MRDTERGGTQYRYRAVPGLVRASPGSLPERLEESEMVYELLGGFDTIGGLAEWMDADQIAARAGEPTEKIEAILGGLVGVGFVEVRTIKELE